MTTPADYLEQRFQQMAARVRDAYDGIGHSSGRPYLYFVYPPERDAYVRRMADELLHDDGVFSYHHIDLVRLSIDALAGQEEKRAELLRDQTRGSGAATAILRLWSRRLGSEIEAKLAGCSEEMRPVVVLLGLAALHPLGNPTALMEALAEREPRHPVTGRTVPVVLLVPGAHVPGASRTYLFLGRDEERLSFYRGEEI